MCNLDHGLVGHSQGCKETAGVNDDSSMCNLDHGLVGHSQGCKETAGVNDDSVLSIFSSMFGHQT